MKTKKPSRWLFRLVSNRGTDITVCVNLPQGTTIKKAKEYAEEWSNNIISNSPITECTVSYHRVRTESHATVLKRLRKAHRRYQSAKEAYDKLHAQLNISNYFMN
jgi:hypothetical protein